MDLVLRSVIVYAFLVVLFRLAGKRTLGNITTFDFVLLLIISEATQQALVGQDASLTGAFVVVGTLVLLDIALSLVKQRWEKVERIMDGAPLVVVENGVPLTTRLRMTRIDEDDILEAARASQGLETLEQVKYAVLERNGKISIIPR